MVDNRVVEMKEMLESEIRSKETQLAVLKAD